MMQKHGRSWFLFVLDLTAIMCLYYGFHHYYNDTLLVTYKGMGFMATVVMIWVVLAANTRLCVLTAGTRIWDLLRATVQAYSLLSVVLIFLVVVFDQFKPNANLVLYPLLVGFFISLGMRLAAFAVRRHFVSHGYMQKSVLVVGGDRLAERVVEKMNTEPHLGYRLVGILADYYHETMPPGLYMGKLARLNRILSSNVVDEVLIALPLRRESEILDAVAACELEGVRFRIIPDFFRVIESRAVLDYMGDIPLISIRTEPLISLRNRLIKRAFDIAFSGGGLFVLSPVFLVIGILIKMSSPGPIFFKQKRISSNNKEFEMFKFRTMKVQETKDSDTIWTTQNDPRVTRIGSFLRKSNLDELPQFWNVLVGHMSVVGPRPERKFFVEKFKEDIPRYKVRHQVKSGISGWAQVNGLRGDTSIADRIAHDLYYIENWSIWVDLLIIWKTLFGKKTNTNAY